MMKTVSDDFPIPPAAQLLGWSLVALNPETGSIEVQFDAIPEFANPSGFIQGGILAAMLDETLGPAAFAMARGVRMATTIDLHIHYLRPVSPGRVTTRARVIKLGATIAFLEGELFDAKGKLTARATASAKLTDYPPGNSAVTQQ